MAQKVDIQSVLPAILEAASTYRTACDDFEAAVQQAKETLTAAANTVATAVVMVREVGLEVSEPFDFADPVSRAFAMIRLTRAPVRLDFEIV